MCRASSLYLRVGSVHKGRVVVAGLDLRVVEGFEGLTSSLCRLCLFHNFCLFTYLLRSTIP